uniref:Uncharacterized protein n=1 Tax=Megaselia scalaris TaxID=36166 RepID=T1GQ81_MEGSC
MPVLFFGIKIWNIKDINEELLAVFERKIRRIIYVLVCDEALFGNFELDVFNGVDMCTGWKRMSQFK